MQHKTISELHEMLASKAITPVELVEESLNLAKKYEFLNCFNFINEEKALNQAKNATFCLLYTSPSPRDRQKSRMPSSA